MIRKPIQDCNPLKQFKNDHSGRRIIHFHCHSHFHWLNQTLYSFFFSFNCDVANWTSIRSCDKSHILFIYWTADSHRITMWMICKDSFRLLLPVAFIRINILYGLWNNLINLNYHPLEIANYIHKMKKHACIRTQLRLAWNGRYHSWKKMKKLIKNIRWSLNQLQSIL